MLEEAIKVIEYILFLIKLTFFTAIDIIKDILFMFIDIINEILQILFFEGKTELEGWGGLIFAMFILYVFFIRQWIHKKKFN